MKVIQQLIQIPSISGSEAVIQKYISGTLYHLGLQPQHIKGNIACHIKGINKSKSLIFNAHVDTVNPGSNKLWMHNPYSGKIIDNKVYGLGASDEKAGVAALLLLAKKLSQNKPACDVWLHFVISEETDGSGTKTVMDWFMKKRGKVYSNIAGILVEPTGLKSIEIGHKGNAFIKLQVAGSSGHGSLPDKLITNSVLTMAKVLLKLDQLNQKWQYQYHDIILGHPTIGVGTSIIAGDILCPNKFADTCIATLDVRTIPQMHDKVLALITKSLVNYPVTVSYTHDPAPYGFTDPNDKLIKSVKKILPKVKISVSSGSTDQCFFTINNIPAVIIGPGEKTGIHQPNEYCLLSKITQSVSIYQKIISTI